MRNLLFTLLSVLLLTACQQQADPKLQEELSRAYTHLQEVETELQQLKAGPEKGRLVHLVFLKTKEGLAEEELAGLLSKIRQLASVEGVKNLEIGKIADTGDPRFISDHDIAFQMDFSSLEVYQAYQVDPAHEAIRNGLKEFLAGPPAVYDYWAE